MTKTLTAHPSSTPQRLLDVLRDGGIRHCVSLAQVQGWLKRFRVLHPVVSADDGSLTIVKDTINKLRADSNWERPNNDSPLLPIEGDHYLFEGSDATKGKRPASSLHGIPYAFCIPVSTPSLLKNRVRAMETRYSRSIRSHFTDRR